MFMIRVLFLFSLVSVACAEPLTFESGNAKVRLMELYTSQGCHSCPPGEAWLDRHLDQKTLWKSVVPVAFHVDYWDYLGWKDPFSSHDFSVRQRRLAHAENSGRVYTPAFFIDGKESRAYFKGKGLSKSSGTPGNLSVTVEGRLLTAAFNGKKAKTLWVALLEHGSTTKVPAGENRGKTLANHFVALDLLSAEAKNGTWQIKLPDLKNAEAIAVWVTGSNPHLPLQATGSWLSVE